MNHQKLLETEQQVQKKDEVKTYKKRNQFRALFLK